MRKEVKTVVVRMRATEAEAKVIKENVDKYGYKNVSQFMRAVCINPNDFAEFEEENPSMEVQEK